MHQKALVPAALYTLLTLLAQAGCLLLYNLSQFGQAPFDQLPLAVVVFFGVLFSAPLLAAGERLGLEARLLTLGGAALLALGFNALIADAAPGVMSYLLAPLSAAALAELYPRLFGQRAAMIAAMSVYTACTLLANYTFDSFLPLPVYGLVNVGTLFFGVTFTQRDRVHRYGRRYAYAMIGFAAAANVVTALSLGTPLRYVAVGFLAIVLSEVADTEVYQRFIDRRWLTRVATSNAVSIPIDTVVFTVLAFYGEPWASPAWMLEVIATDIVVKLIVGFLAAVQIIGARPLPADMPRRHPGLE